MGKSFLQYQGKQIGMLPVGGIAASPALGVATLATSMLNLGLTGYNTYQLRGITKLQKVKLIPCVSQHITTRQSVFFRLAVASWHLPGHSCDTIGR